MTPAGNSTSSRLKLRSLSQEGPDFRGIALLVYNELYGNTVDAPFCASGDEGGLPKAMFPDLEAIQESRAMHGLWAVDLACGTRLFLCVDLA